MSNDDFEMGETTRELSNEYYCVYSAQNYNATYPTGVFVTSVPAKRIGTTSDVTLVHDWADYKKWALSAIIQRSLSEERVHEIRSQYLQDTSRLTKFFPSITVVLVPISTGTTIREPVRNYAEVTSFDSSASLRGIEGIDITPLRKNATDLIEEEPVRLQWCSPPANLTVK